MLTLTPTERRALRAQAHTLDPVVMIGQHGLTPAVLREIDKALDTHELIKVRIFNDDRAEREALQLAICHQLACAPVQHLGKLIVLWRPAPPKAETKPAKRPAKKATPKATKKVAKKALPGAINRHGQAIKPLSARQAREQTRQSTWQPHTRQPRDAEKMYGTMSSPDNRRPPRSGGRSGTHTASAKQTPRSSKPPTTPFPSQSARQPRNAFAAPRPASRRRLGSRGK